MTETISARLTLPADAAASAMRRYLALYEVECNEIAGGIAAEIWGGNLRLVWGDGGVRITAAAPDISRLFVIQEGIAHALDHEGGHAIWDRIDEGALAPNLSLVEVESVTQITPGYRRIRVRGDIARYAGHGLHFRVLIPPDGVVPEWPRLDAKGRARWPSGKQTLHCPVFTTRAMDADAGWLDFDVFLHDGARTTEWSKKAVGAQVGLVGPGGGWLIDDAWVGLYGDETALPVIARMLAALPATSCGEAVIKAAPEDMQDLPRPPGVTLSRVDTQGDLLDALESVRLPATGRRLWFAAEKADAARAREIMRAKGLAKTEMSAAAYWSLD